MPELSTALSSAGRPGWLGTLLGRLLARIYRLAGRHRYDEFRLETVGGLRVLVLPTVANPRLLRTGAFFAATLNARSIPAGDRVLDLGTGSGICALAAAKLGGEVVATDINPAAVRCCRINAEINHLEQRVDARSGDLFGPVAGERFDLVLFNPPFLPGPPKDDRDAAWRSGDVPQRFARGLAAHLHPGGSALLLLSTYGDACAAYETELRQNGFLLSVYARRRYVNETLTIVRALPPSEDRTATQIAPLAASSRDARAEPAATPSSPTQSSTSGGAA